MRPLALLLVVAGFLAGAYQAVRVPQGVSIAPYLAALVLGAAGVALLRWHARKTASAAETVAAGMSELRERIGRLAENARTFELDAPTLPVDDFRQRVETVFADDLSGFAERRETISVRHGLQAYADVMSPFASAERHLNRVWSASTDGYIEEARTYVTRAREELEDAREALGKLSENA